MHNKLTLDDISGSIRKAEYQCMGKKTVVCLLTLENGYEVVGSAGVIDPANFDMEIGRKVAYERALNQVWQLEGYLAQERLYRQTSDEA